MIACDIFISSWSSEIWTKPASYDIIICDFRAMFLMNILTIILGDMEIKMILLLVFEENLTHKIKLIWKTLKQLKLFHSLSYFLICVIFSLDVASASFEYLLSVVTNMYVRMHVSNIHVSAVVMLDVRVFPCGVYLHNQTDTIQKVHV